MTLLLLFSFFLGSIPVGFLIAKAHGIDIREKGSGNVGATNVGRAVGKKAGIYTLIADIAKGAIPVVVVAISLRESVSFEEVSFTQAAAAIAAVLGHCFSPLLRGRGGKGVATGFGAFLALAPLTALLAVLAFLVCLKVSGFVSLSSITAAITFPILVYFEVPTAYPYSTLLAATSVATIVTVKHYSNIKRLLNRTEQKFSSRKSQESN